MTWTSKAVGRLLGLPAARTRKVSVQRDIPIVMPDGISLLMDRYFPAEDPRAPLVFIRGPYGRDGAYGLMARIIAERGYQVVQQSLRGTFGSGGVFNAFILAPEDRRETMAWLREQPWFPGSMATWGTSYLGYVQWELASEAIPEWKAAIIQDAPSEFYHSFMYPGGVFALGNALAWVQVVHTMFRTGGSFLRQLPGAVTGPRRLRRAALGNITDADTAAVGETVPYFQEWLRHPEPDEYWARMDFRSNAANMPGTVLLCGGWYDFFLPGMLADHAALRRSGCRVRLIIGPWSHGRGLNTRLYMRESFAVLDHALRGEGDWPASPVWLNITGASNWAEFSGWPPPGYRPTPWYLHGGGRLTRRPPPPAPASRFRYSPTDPTPSVGGAVVSVHAGPKDNRRIEARPDILVFTSSPLTQDVEIIGPVTAQIHIRSNRPSSDVFVRLCDVAPGGRSTNLCDGIKRLRPGKAPAVPGTGNVLTARVELWPTAHLFPQGHRIRLQVSGGAHPRYARNTGTENPLDAHTEPADLEIFHDPEHPSSISLPVRG